MSDASQVFVSMTEEQVARTWLWKNNLCAVEWVVINALVKNQLEDPIVRYDAINSTYHLWPKHSVFGDDEHGAPDARTS